MTSIDVMRSSHYVYRIYDRENVLLYVGCSAAPDRRVRAHRLGQAWGGDIARVEVDPALNRLAAMFDEGRQIRELCPTHNVHYNASRYPAEAKRWRMCPPTP